MGIDLVEKLASSGLLGLLLALAIGAIIYLYRDNKSLNKDIRDLLVNQVTTNQTFQKTLDILVAKLGER